MDDLLKSNWAEVSRLLDEALDLPPNARPAWLAALALERADYASLLARLLAVRDGRPPPLVAAAAVVPDPPGTAALESLDTLRGYGPGDQIGPYQLIELIGTGGMAVVWLAERSDGVPKRQVALKLPRQFVWNARRTARFHRERDMLARLEHPNIARLYEAGMAPARDADGRVPYLALEYVRGENILTCCDHQTLDVRARLALFAQVLTAVQYAHARLVLHRDLKPGNILVTADRQVRLLDFGVGKLLVESLATAQQDDLTEMVGQAYTPAYASPEQGLGSELTTASDVYSLGVVLYELLTGCRPFDRHPAGPADPDRRWLAVAPPASSQVTAGQAALRGTTEAKLRRILRGELDTILAKALQPAPVRRYGTVAEFAEDLRRFAAGERVLAQPDSWIYRARKYARRNLAVVGSAVAITLALSIGLAVALWQAAAADVAYQQAERLATRNVAVNEFMRAMLAGSQLSETRTVGALLEQGERSIDRRFADDPASRAAVRSLFADYYSQTGMDATARPLWQRAVADARASGQNDLIAATTCASAGSATVLGDGRSIRDSIVAALALPGLAAHERANCLLALSQVDYTAGHLEAGLSYAREADRLLQPLAARYPMDAIQASDWLAQMWQFNQRFDLALQLYPQALARLRGIGREHDPLTVTVTNDYGTALIQSGDPYAAAQVLGALQARFVTTSSAVPMYGYLYFNLCSALLLSGQNAAALRLTEDPAFARAGREDVTIEPWRLMERAEALRNLGRLDEAAGTLDAAKLLLARKPDLAQEASNLELSYVRLERSQGRYAPARERLRSLAASASTSTQIKNAGAALDAELDLLEGRADRAAIKARVVLQRYQQQTPPGRWSFLIGTADILLARALQAQGQPAETRSLLQAGVDHLQHTLHPAAPGLLEARRLLAQAGDQH